MRAPDSWDVFCRVIDNFGDAAVCWRLAQRLAQIDGTTHTRLLIDDLGALHSLEPNVSVERERQTLHGVDIRRWAGGTDFGAPADVALESFGCGLPDVYVTALAARSPRPLWIVLEYLSAEPWVRSHHGLPSPHPQLPLERYFFFPGFSAGTGGLLREPEFGVRREAFLRDEARRPDFWRAAGFPPPESGARLVSLFGYENRAVAEIMAAWSEGSGPVVAAIPRSRLSAQAAAHFGIAGVPDNGKALRRGALEARFMPFLSQDRYDELLWAADWNFVRGEDSFVRAQWAERPLVWHVYPQSDAAHMAKMGAFLDVYCAGLPTTVTAKLRKLWKCWNQEGGSDSGTLSETWDALSQENQRLAAHAHAWARSLTDVGDLAENLAKFCAARLK
jgi:uncharacterized repeat protein (TIGR03837 family)